MPVRRLLPVLAAALLTLSVPAHAQNPALDAPARSLDAGQWRTDLDSLMSDLARVHPDPFLRSGKAPFDSAVAALDARIPKMSEREVATAFMQVTALVQDGHTGAIAMLPQFGFRTFFPVRLTVEDGALYVVSAASKYRAVVGGRVTALGRLPAQAALARVLTVCSGDNYFSRIDRAPIFMMSPGVMAALGVTPTGGPLHLEVETPAAGRAKPGHAGADVVAVEPAAGRYPAFFQDPEGLPVADGVAFRDGAPGETPLHLRDPERAWWFVPVPDLDLVYFQFRRVDREDRGRTFASFVDSLFQWVDSSGVRNMVIDLRHNGGGDNSILQPLIHGLIKRDDGVNREGHLYTIIGRETFSAAMNCANWLEEHTHTRFVGEPTGARPNSFGDATTVRLPNSGMPVRISRYRWAARWPWDDRLWIAPDLPAPPSIALARQNRDPAMEAIAEEIAEKPMLVRLRAALEADRVDEARKIYFDDKRRHPDRWGHTSIDETTALARALFAAGHPASAFALATFNTEIYPDSAEVWTTLGAGYVMAGKKEAAIAPLQKALQLDPGNEAARRWLERAGGPAAKTAGH